ncbi:MAG: (Fe-S)-binding protein [Verrucomicrobiae bacterium]|nr:(Fe-S)-binding protein [Verrucomicrobiae bacterium]
MNPANDSRSFLRDLDYSVLQQCIHCGMCLPSCPTYDATKREVSSPRGRIALMRAVADGEQPVSGHFSEEMYFCLGCLACQSVCPAGVNYEELIEAARAEVQRVRPNPSLSRKILLRWLFSSRARLRIAARLLWLAQRSGLEAFARRTGLIALLGKKMAELAPLSPRIETHFTPYGRFPARGPRKMRVGLLAGCVQDVAFASVNRDTIEVLQANGHEVVVPPAQQCCGSLHGHNGEHDLAVELARANLEAFPLEQLDAILVNSAGCGSFMKHYDQALANDSCHADRAAVWSGKVMDVSEFLMHTGLRTPKCAPLGATVTYHDACHLAHGQAIRGEPRQLLASIPGIDLRELKEADWCCGSAGIYNITHPDLAAELARRKLRNIQASGAKIVACANPGCAIQIDAEARRAGLPLVVRHPVSLLAEAYRREAPGA